MCPLFEERKGRRTLATQNTAKYLIIALWCTYEILSVPFLLIARAPISIWTGLAWFRAFNPYEHVSMFAIYVYTAFIILGFLLGWLFVISDKTKTLRKRAIMMGIFLGIVTCFLALAIAFSTRTLPF